MPDFPATFATSVVHAPLQEQFEVFLDEHRAALAASLDGLTEEQARRRLVPSKTTLLGLVKHAAYVERVWFDSVITCRSRSELGIPEVSAESFDLVDDDTIASVVATYREACAISRTATAALGFDDVVHGSKHGSLPLRWIYLHCLRELAQHCGHADILREQILAADDRS